jgi:antitoxin component YwqK of YwqJK toxin-antitoxin module
MKYLYPVSLMLLLLTSCGKDEKNAIDRDKTDWATYKLKGNVKAISEKSYETFDGKGKGPTKHEVMSEHDRDLEFNDEGMLIAEKTWSNDAKPFEEIKYKGKNFKISHTQYVSGAASIRTDYVWDEKGRNNLSVIRRNADNTPFDKVVMKYKNDKILERATFNQQGNLTDKVTYFYDDKGNLKGENRYLATDVVQYKAEYDYDDKGRKVTEKHYDGNGKMDYETRYTYSGDKPVAVETFNAAGEVIYVEKKTYDKDGNVLSDYSFDKFDGKHMRDTYTYDKKGNRTAWETYEGDKIKMKVSYTFDKYNNITKVLAVDSEGAVVDSRLYNYEYDKTSNWTRKLYIQNDRPAVITERKITYLED